MHFNSVGSLSSDTQTPAVTASPRLQTAAHQFEASLLTELLKPMRDRSAFSGKDEDGGGGDDDSNSGGSMREYGTEAMAQALSEHGGIGIAKLVLMKLAPAETAGPGQSEVKAK